MSNFEPAAGKILVDRTPKKESVGVFHMPQTAVEVPADGVIVAIGKGRMRDGGREEVEWAVGDHIHYARYTDEEIVLEGKHYFLVRFEHVQGVQK